MNVPNLLTVLRAALAPALVALVAYERYGWALAAFLVAGATDLLDGFIARRFHQLTAIGAVLDPIADKLLVTSTILTLTLHDGPVRIPAWLATLVIGRDVALFAVSLIVVWRRGEKDFRPTLSGKATTVFQFAFLTAVLVDNARGAESRLFLPLAAAAVACTAVSGGHYLVLALRRLRPQA